MIASKFARVTQLNNKLKSNLLHFPRQQSHRGLFYECSAFTLAKYERSLIEKSLNAGCTTFFTRSGPHFLQLHEHLADLQYELNDGIQSEEENNSANEKKLHIGHILSSQKNIPNSQVLSVMKSELQQLVAGMEKNQQTLKYLSIHFPPSFWQREEIAHGLVELLPPFHSFLNGSKTKIGLDISTRLLTELSAGHVIPVLGPLLKEHIIEFITLASNPFTAPQASLLQERILSDYKVKPLVFGTEILRLHPVKPGQLSPNYDYKFPHHYRYTSASSNSTSSSSSDTTVSSSNGTDMSQKKVIEMVETPTTDGTVEFAAATSAATVHTTLSAKEEEAVADLRAALDRAVTIEKVFLDKFSDRAKALGVRVTDVCLGHLLTQMHNRMTFVEEYEFFLASHMDPLFEQAIDTLTKSDLDLRNWVALYRPMAHYVQASYRNLLQQRQLQLIQRLFDDKRQHDDIAATSDNTKAAASPIARIDGDDEYDSIPSIDTKDMPYLLATMAHHRFRFDDCGLSLMVVQPAVYQQIQKRFKSVSTSIIDRRYDSMRKMTLDYSANQEAK